MPDRYGLAITGAVVDASSFPSLAPVNLRPATTANALRVADHLRKRTA